MEQPADTTQTSFKTRAILLGAGVGIVLGGLFGHAGEGLVFGAAAGVLAAAVIKR